MLPLVLDINNLISENSAEVKALHSCTVICTRIAMNSLLAVGMVARGW